VVKRLSIEHRELNMTTTTTQLNQGESLSALVDGDTAAHLPFNDLQDTTLRADWNTYQTIGEVLRTPASVSATFGADPAFLQRLSARLAHENIESPGHTVSAGSVGKSQVLAANDTSFRWKLVAGLASLGAVGAVAWSLIGLPSSKSEPQLAQGVSGSELVVASPQGLMVRDARLEELLSAHKQLGGTSLQAPSGFLRNAGFESTQNDRR
jgi:sigma-E factor negative regulatory protein RseA